MELIFCCVKESDDLMVNIIKEDLDIEEALKRKLEFICSFCNTKYEIKKVQLEQQKEQTPQLYASEGIEAKDIYLVTKNYLILEIVFKLIYLFKTLLIG